MPERSKLMSAIGSNKETRTEVKKIIRERKDLKRPTGIPAYLSGANRSRAVLKDISYDPIRELVKRYRVLEEEVDFWKGVRSGAIVVVREGKPDLRYSPEAHSACEAMLISIGEKLLRYGYGRVPEVDNSERRPTPLIIDLGARDGTLTIGRDPVTYEQEEEDV